MGQASALRNAEHKGLHDDLRGVVVVLKWSAWAVVGPRVNHMSRRLKTNNRRA